MDTCNQNGFSLRSITIIPPTKTCKYHLAKTRTQSFRCNSSLQSTTLKTEPEPVLTSVKSFAPATVANLGPGFDFLGCAVDGIGDYVSLRINPEVQPGELSISSIEGVGNSATKLTKNPLWNCAGIAAISTMKMLGIQSVGLSLSLEKGLPLGSGLGSSAASAAAAAVAVNEIFGGKLSVSDLVLAGLDSESKVSGYHADNIAPALMGGFVLIRSYQPLDLMPLKFPAEKELLFVLVNPEFEAPTKKMRAVLPREIGMKEHLWNCSQAGALVASVLRGDLKGLGMAMSSDMIVEPRRAPLIPGIEAVKAAAMEAGAFGCTISGAGPTIVAVTDNEEKGKEIGYQMVEAFINDGGLKASAMVRRLDRIGARVISSSPLCGQSSTWGHALGEEGISAETVESYAKSLGQPELLDLLVQPSSEDVAMEEVEDLRPSKRKVIYSEHKPMSEITLDLHRGIYHQGKLRVNRYNPFEAYVGSESIGDEITIYGRANMNRAFNGDIVMVELLPQNQWHEEKSLSVADDEDEEEEDVRLVPVGANDAPRNTISSLGSTGDANPAPCRPSGCVVGIMKRNWNLARG